MIELRGSQANPVTNISLLNLKISANRPTFFDPRANPSGGDWALERMGAVLVEGAEDLLIRGCTFTKLDSNAVSLNGYNQRVWIDQNHFSWIGQNAVASWGRSEDYNNGTAGNFPRYTRMTNNFATEVGVIQKQSSMYFQAETAEATISNNICFNIPRAAINFNDGFGGGATMTANLLFNTCRAGCSQLCGRVHGRSCVAESWLQLCGRVHGRSCVAEFKVAVVWQSSWSQLADCFLFRECYSDSRCCWG
jgi:hypothetical protein